MYLLMLFCACFYFLAELPRDCPWGVRVRYMQFWRHKKMCLSLLSQLDFYPFTVECVCCLETQGS